MSLTLKRKAEIVEYEEGKMFRTGDRTRETGLFRTTQNPIGMVRSDFARI